MANHDHTPPLRAAPNGTRSATLDDFTQQLSEARTITDIIIALSEASLNGTIDPANGLYTWLAAELDARLERVEVAGQTLRVRGC